MKKLGKLNLMKEKMLSHEELVSFRGGSGGGGCSGASGCGKTGSTCQIYIRSECGSGSGYWTQKLFTVAEAQCHYNGGSVWEGDYKTTGYCCASC